MIDRIGLPAPLAPACPDSGIPAGASPDRAPLAAGLPGLSVILPSFNVAAIQDVATAAAACSEADEVIVVDDGATQLAARFVAGDGRARLVVHPA
ncbi:MAG TPA: glycosyltransferase, partial [Solirubrobacteraceae bacterium]